MPDIRDLLRDAAPQPGRGPDLAAIESRVTRRRRLRHGAVAASVAGLVAAVVAAVSLSGSPFRERVQEGGRPGGSDSSITAASTTVPSTAVPSTTVPGPGALAASVPPAATTVPATTPPGVTPTNPSTTVPANTPSVAVPPSWAVTATGRGVTMSLWESPRTGTVGSTSIQAWATVTGSVPAGTIDFLVGSGPADQGQPWSDQPVTVAGPGTYAMPQPYQPTRPGKYAVSASFYNTSITFITIGGLPATSGLPYPHPSLVTTVTGSVPPPTTAPTANLPGAPPCDSQPMTHYAKVKPAGVLFGCATSADGVTVTNWTSWTATSATGSGIHAVNNCTPNCAEGSYTKFPVTIVLSNPGNVGGLFVFKTITTTPTGSVGKSETATLSGNFGLWGW